MKRIFLFVLILLAFATVALADEGMWLYNAFPKEKVKAQYGFEPTQEWLDHLRLSTVRFPNGTGSFVSADGLVFTNHHIGSRCVQELSKSGTDYMKNGFYAKSKSEEAKCPNMELNVLVGIEDVTNKVTEGTKDMSIADAGRKQRANMAAIEKDCATSTGQRCDVVTLYAGGMYHLYKYKKYTDVRLVFAPEFQMAFFGGDEDNFTYPRYDLDITFFRAYENGQPAVIKDYLRWSKTGVKDGDLVFVSGHPGSTGRWLTISQLWFLRDTEYPYRLDTYKRRIAALKAFSAQSAENARIAQEDIFGLENSQKAVAGYNTAFANQQQMERKTGEEKQLRDSLVNNPKKREEFGGDPWAQITKAMETEKQIFLPLTYLERRNALRGDLAGFARELVRVATEKQKPNADRLREYRESATATLEQNLFSEAPIYKELEIALLTESLQEAQDYMGKSNADIVAKLLAGKSPADRARELIETTKLDDVAFRKQLYTGGQAAIDASTDPLVVLMREIDPEARKYRKIFDDEVDSVEKREGSKIARLKFEKGGLNLPPDATFTLRLSYGAVKGYSEAGKPVASTTTSEGAFKHAIAARNQAPDQLPTSWTESKSKLAMETPLNFVSTPDIIGGNSGSPIVNKNAEVVGIIFDGNIQSLPWRFYFDDVQGRAVSVDSRGIQEALRKIYSATPLAEELFNGRLGTAAEGTAVGK